MSENNTNTDRQTSVPQQIVPIPSCGRIVHFFPVKDAICKANNAKMVPAIVVQASGNYSINISAFPMNPDATNVLRYSVCHLSEVAKDEGGTPINDYWDWPARN